MFDLGAAMSGAGTGAALGPWGAIGGGLLGGFMGGMKPKPEVYGKEQMMETMKPYTDMLGDYKDRALGMMDPNSAANRGMQNKMKSQSMDQMALANIMAQRADAANPYSGGSGVAQQQMANNQFQYANQASNAFGTYMQGQQQAGMSAYGNAMSQTGSLYGSAANLEAANLGDRNKLAAQKHEAMMGGVGQFISGGGLGAMGEGFGLLAGHMKGPDGTPQIGVDNLNTGGGGIGMSNRKYNLLGK